jgi:hypothetical protein
MNKSSERPFKALGDVLLRAVGEQPQSEVARNLFVSQPAVHSWMSGKRRPAPWRVGLLAHIYNQSPEHLAKLAGYDTNPDAFQQVIDSYNDRVKLLSKERQVGGNNDKT